MKVVSLSHQAHCHFFPITNQTAHLSQQQRWEKCCVFPLLRTVKTLLWKTKACRSAVWQIWSSFRSQNPWLTDAEKNRHETACGHLYDVTSHNLIFKSRESNYVPFYINKYTQGLHTFKEILNRNIPHANNHLLHYEKVFSFILAQSCLQTSVQQRQRLFFVHSLSNTVHTVLNPQWLSGNIDKCCKWVASKPKYISHWRKH